MENCELYLTQSGQALTETQADHLGIGAQVFLGPGLQRALRQARHKKRGNPN